jgi:hypothetical protein
MKRIVIWTMSVVLFASVGTTSATTTDPFIRVATVPDELDLGTAIFFQGVYEVQNALKVEVETNCFHGPVVISTTPLERHGGGRIEPDDIFVRTSKIGQYVSLKKPVIILPTGAGSQEITVDFKVHAGLDRPSGQYKGIITLTVMPPV